MRGMKITVDTAMRARDVSRPRPEHEKLARDSEAAAGVSGAERVKHGPDGQAGAAGSGYPASPADDEAAAGSGRTPRPGSGRRRRRRRLQAPGGASTEQPEAGQKTCAPDLSGDQ
jgi:hypothetical protein